MQRLANPLLFVSVVIAAGFGGKNAAGQPWQSDTAAAVPYPSAYGQRAVPSPPQAPDAVTRPESWPGMPAGPGFTPAGGNFGTEMPAAATAGMYPQVPQGGGGEDAPDAVPWVNPLSAPDVPTYEAVPRRPGVPAGRGPSMAPAKPQHPPADSGAAAEAQFDTGSEVVAELELCEGAQPLATVGSAWILAGEILGSVNDILKMNADRIPKGQLEEQRNLLIRQKLTERIQTKLIYQDARRTIPEENYPMIEEKLGEFFAEKELPALMKRASATSPQDLDARLQALGTSIGQEKRAFMERALAQQWVQEQVKTNEEISHEQMLAYYHGHLADYEYPAQARWEQLMVRFSSHPDKQAAHAAIAEMGNQVLRGVPLAEVAKARSEGPLAKDGGQRDWTSKGSLVSKALDDAIFGLPVGRLSRIIEDEQGLHIVRVIERKEAGRTPFLEAQVGIREKIREQRRRDKLEEYLARLKEEIPVWTVFDDPQTASSMAGSLSR